MEYTFYDLSEMEFGNWYNPCAVLSNCRDQNSYNTK